VQVIGTYHPPQAAKPLEVTEPIEGQLEIYTEWRGGRTLVLSITPDQHEVWGPGWNDNPPEWLSAIRDGALALYREVKHK